MTAPFSNDTHRFFIHTKISNEDEVLLSEYIKDFPHGYWGKNINIHKDAKTGSIKLQTGTIYMSYTNMNLPKNKSNTFELKVCYTKEDVYILWKKYMQKKKMQLNLRDCVFQKNAKSWRRN